MVNLSILPAEASATCLCVGSFLRSLPEPLRSRLHVQPSPTPSTDALMWLPNIAQGDTSGRLREILLAAPRIRFVQLPMTGVEHFMPLMREMQGRRIVWCSAKGCYSALVAEHALALCLGMLKGLHGRSVENESLFRKKVLIVGRGSIATQLSALLSPFDCALSYTDSSSSSAQLHSAASQAQVIFITCPLTPSTANLFNTTLLAALDPHALLINIARGHIINTTALLHSLAANPAQRAALDVVHYSSAHEKQQLEMLERQGRVLITHHAAIPSKLIPEVLGERLCWNLRVLVDVEEGKVDVQDEEAWKGRVDVGKGY
ncbi:hypothetical protein EX895_003674 [Sporisorium graminicola]|uniref:D-isomer specific 2-hydroxyacid dehydrogenase NAD-binding domain-containing protein n=1 Tax=Sporisorium graminicola TaxID=280036 RepID=A0A4U7KSK5_9BASI|nr:hypothetical protein EX895_003674 [Sporisorium graminicola]TKY86997.1 hypothetical protein EX895_003674 [Sporisorium graminicola]